ncbi:hypothetical protein STENM327S_03899 [Streptomyces tendae]
MNATVRLEEVAVLTLTRRSAPRSPAPHPSVCRWRPGPNVTRVAPSSAEFGGRGAAPGAGRPRSSGPWMPARSSGTTPTGAADRIHAVGARGDVRGGPSIGRDRSSTPRRTCRSGRSGTAGPRRPAPRPATRRARRVLEHPAGESSRLQPTAPRLQQPLHQSPGPARTRPRRPPTPGRRPPGDPRDRREHLVGRGPRPVPERRRRPRRSASRAPGNRPERRRGRSPRPRGPAGRAGRPERRPWCRAR